MVDKVQLLITITVTALFLPHSVKSATGDISVSPGNRVTPSTDVVIECGVDRTQNPGVNVVWKKKSDSLTIKLGTDDGLDQTFSQRYELRRQISGGVDTFTLKIKDAQYEDSGTYECQRVYGGTEGASTHVVLAVCDDTDSQACKCMETEGWGKPTCFDQPEDAQVIIDRYKGAIIGVVVCLIIAIIYGVIVSVMLSRDCLQRMRLKAKKKLEAMQNEKTIPDDASTKHLNDSNESVPYDGAMYHDSPGLYHIPEHSSHQVERDYRYEKENMAANQHTASVHHHHQHREREEHDNKAFDSDEKPYTQIGPTISESHRPTPIHSPGMSDSSSDSWGHGARPKTTRQNPLTTHNAPEAGYQPQSGVKPARQTGRQNFPQPGSHFHTESNTNQEPVNMISSGHGALTPRTNQPQHGKRNQAPSYPGQNDNRGRNPGGKYETYEGGLQNVSQQMPANPTPQSTHSEQLANSPGDIVELKQRGAFTDVRHDKAADSQRNGHATRGHYSHPRKLDYPNGGLNNTGHTVPSSTGAYVSETDTMI